MIGGAGSTGTIWASSNLILVAGWLSFHTVTHVGGTSTRSWPGVEGRHNARQILEDRAISVIKVGGCRACGPREIPIKDLLALDLRLRLADPALCRGERGVMREARAWAGASRAGHCPMTRGSGRGPDPKPILAARNPPFQLPRADAEQRPMHPESHLRFRLADSALRR